MPNVNSCACLDCQSKSIAAEALNDVKFDDDVEDVLEELRDYSQFTDMTSTYREQGESMADWVERICLVKPVEDINQEELFLFPVSMDENNSSDTSETEDFCC